MPNTAELKRQLAKVKSNPELQCIDGLDAFRPLLAKDRDGRVARFLTSALSKLPGPERGGLAYMLAERYRESGDLDSLEKLFALDDTNVTDGGLGALCGEPGPNPAMGPAILRLAIVATKHPSAAVRGSACVTIMNQSSYKGDLSAAVEPLGRLLGDRALSVRPPAAYAVGHLAKKRYDLARLLPALRRNAAHENLFVRESSAWALNCLSQSRNDIGAAVPELVGVLTFDEDWGSPRRCAAAALLRYAGKSPDNCRIVKDCVKRTRLDGKLKEVGIFLERLRELPSVE
jgi:hypothetical protein